MQFLAPLFLLGALAVTIPILLHLVQREQSDRIPFSSLMFLRRIPAREFRRQRLKYLLLLFLRTLGILLLVGAFARPVITWAWFDQVSPLTARSVLFLLDNSLSMGREGVWETAVAALEGEIRSLQGGDEGMLAQFAESGSVLTRWEQDPQRLLGPLRQTVRPSFEGTSYFTGLRLAAEQFRDAANSRREIVLVTDLQRSGLDGSSWRLPPDVSLRVVDVGKETENLYIADVRVERPVFSQRYPHPILVEVRSSPSAVRKGEVQLLLENRLVDRQSFELTEDGVGRLSFRPFEIEEGITRGRIVLEPSDSLSADNEFHFVLEREAPRRIRVLTSRNQDPPAFFLRNALGTGEGSPFQVEDDGPTPRGSFQEDGTALLVLDDLAEAPPRDSIAAFLEQGGGVVLTLGHRSRPETYHERWSDLLPARIVERRFARSGGGNFVSVTEVNWSHPVFSVFQEGQTGLVAVQFFSYWSLEPREEAQVLARFSGGDPAVLEKRVGRGRILLLAFPLDPVWNDFALRSAFVPFWHRVVRYTSGWESAPAAYSVAQAIPVEPPEGDLSSGWNAIDPEGGRVFGLDETRPGYIQLKLPGYYEIRKGRETDWVAVNPSRSESDLESIPEEEFLAIFSTRGPDTAAGAPQVTMRERENRQSLWWLFLAAAALVFLIEAVLANHYRAAGRPAVSRANG